MPAERFELTFPASDGPQNDALDGAATGIGWMYFANHNFVSMLQIEIMSLSQWPVT
jgi:hypothetical protein